MAKKKVIQRFMIGTPEELRALKAFATGGSGKSIERVASVWEHGKQRNGKTPWDERMVIEFSTENRRRHATITRSSGDKAVSFGEFMYNKALQWCRCHLRRYVT